MVNDQKKQPSLFAASGLYLLAAIGLWLISLFAADLTGLFPGLTAEGKNLVTNAAYYLPFVALPVIFWARRRGDAQRVLKLNPLPFGAMISVCIAAYFTMLIVQNISMLWMIIWQKLGLNVFVEDYIRPANRSELTLSVIAGAMLAPVGEELLFRGAMLSAWEKRGAKTAVLVTAVLFALMHGSLLGLPGEVFGGLMLGLVVIWSDSIYAGLAFHTVYNASALLTTYQNSAVPLEAAEEALMRSDVLAYLGGFGMVPVLLLDILLMLVLIALVTRRLRMFYAFRGMMRMLQDKPADLKRGQLMKPGQLFIQSPIDRAPMTMPAVLVLMAGIVSSLGLYIMDILSMLGG